MSLRAPLNRRSIFKIKKRYFTCEGYEQHAYECPAVKCSKCEEFRHYDYLCALKSIYIDIVRIDDFHSLRIAKDVHIPFEVTSDVDELIKSSTPALNKIYVHKVSINDVQNALLEFSIPSDDVRCSLSTSTIERY